MLARGILWVPCPPSRPQLTGGSVLATGRTRRARRLEQGSCPPGTPTVLGRPLGAAFQTPFSPSRSLTCKVKSVRGKMAIQSQRRWQGLCRALEWLNSFEPAVA